jgi:hypothetical protein
MVPGHSSPCSLLCSEKKCDGSNAIEDVCKGLGREKKVMKEYRLLEVVYQVRRGK